MTDNGTSEPVQPPQPSANLPALRRELHAQLDDQASSPTLDVRVLLRLLARNHASFSRSVDASAGASRVLRALVAACGDRPVNVDALADAMERVAAPKPSALVHTLRALSDELAAADLMDHADLAELRRLTQQLDVPDLHRVAEACLPPLSADLPPHCTSAWTTALHLLRRNVLPGSLPPLLAFIEYVAAVQPSPAAASPLKQWTEAKATQWGAAQDLLSARAEASRFAGSTPPSDSRIMIALFPDGLRSDLYTLRTWHHDPETTNSPSMRGEDAQVDFRQIAQAAYDSIKRWVRRLTRRESVCVEFWLPLTLFNQPVWEWCTPGGNEEGLPHLNVIVRSLERLQLPVLHPPWRNRWEHLMDAKAHHPTFLHEHRSGAYSGASDLVVLSTPPDATTGRTELLAALRNGAPVILWHREDCTSAAFRQSVRQLIEEGPLKDLPSRVSALRRESLHATDEKEEAARGITLLWDDPDRLLPTMPTLVAPGWEEREPAVGMPMLTARGEAK
ncbi:hypothetical protein [Streptomyces sp. NPDC093225]|uniref:VMAP-C domain-containing protein n=1 Tax=Streptomyces sp. NPDC093225 TaxID=3366034 RepID=UPI003812C48C